MLDYFAREAGKQGGDPSKAARVMFDAVNSDVPPLRLMAGQDAYRARDAAIAARHADLAAWRGRGEATAYDGVETTSIGPFRLGRRMPRSLRLFVPRPSVDRACASPPAVFQSTGGTSGAN